MSVETTRSAPAPVGSATLSVATVLAVIRRPDLWPTALRTVARLAAPGWWRRAPYLPLPDPDYLRFRMITAYGGDGTHPAEPQDLVSYLEWCRAWPSVVGRS